MISLCGASTEERVRPLPADGIVSRPMASFTHAVTIEATPEAVWPWLAQVGADRAGWYSYDVLDNGGVPSARVIRPDLQSIRVGDVLPAVPGATDAFVVADVDPPRLLVLTAPSELGTPIVSWTFLLEPRGEGQTRLLARVRAANEWRQAARSSGSGEGSELVHRIYRVLGRLPLPVLVGTVGIGHGLMQGRMLQGIKERAEGAAAPAGHGSE